MGGWLGQGGPCQVPSEGFQGRQTIPWWLEGQHCCLKTQKEVKVRLGLTLHHKKKTKKHSCLVIFKLQYIRAQTHRNYTFLLMCVALVQLVLDMWFSDCVHGVARVHVYLHACVYDLKCEHVCVYVCNPSSKFTALPSCPCSSSSSP